MRFCVNCYVDATYGYFNGFLIIAWVRTNMLRSYWIEMTKGNYVKLNDAFCNVCKLVWAINVEL